jgi:hypothetical protein
VVKALDLPAVVEYPVVVLPFDCHLVQAIESVVDGIV